MTSDPNRRRSGTRPAIPSLRILVVDDEPLMVRIVARVLSRDGHVVTTTTRGRDVLEDAAADEFDVALLDVRMPDIDGVDLARALAARHPGLWIIMMTGGGEVLEGPHHHVLRKPFDKAQLRAALPRKHTIASPTAQTERSS